MKELYIVFAAAAVIIVGVYLSKRKKDEGLAQEIVDEIQFDKIIAFFKGKANVLKPNVKAIGLRINKESDLKKYNLSYLEGKEGVVLAFFDESTSSIEISNSKLLVSNKLDKPTLEAFGDKEMIIFN